MGLPVLTYGSFASQGGECALSISRRAIVESGMAVGYTERWDIEGRAQADTAEGVLALIAAREAAFKIPNQDLIFTLPDGTIGHSLYSAQTQGGVRTVEFVGYPIGRGAEFSTWRTWRVALECTYLDQSIDLVAWTESIQYSGGGPRVIWLEPLSGTPIAQLANQYTTFKARQSGSAVGLTSYPFAPAPIWPAYFQQNQSSVSTSLPDRTGRGGSAFYSRFKTSWSYAFEADIELIGSPTAWYD